MKNLDVAWFHSVVYVGPDNAADRLATVHSIHRKMLAKAPSRIREKWERIEPCRWPRLTSPQDLVREVEASVGLPIQGKPKVFHDLWPEADLGPMPLFVRFELILAGFDLSFVLDEKGRATIVPMPPAARFQRAVEIPPGKRTEIERLLVQHHRAELSGQRLRASWRVHELVRRRLYPTAKATQQEHVRYTLRAENQQLGTFLNALCKQLGLTCEFKDVTDEALAKRISFEVKDATLPHLFGAILRPAGLQFELQTGKVRVSPQKRETQ